MGRKINPKIFRNPFIKKWDSKWFGNKNEYRKLLQEDLAIRDFLNKELKGGGVSKLILERLAKKINITIHTAKPGLVIGRGGAQIEKLKEKLKKEFLKKGHKLEVNVVEENKPRMSAEVVLETIVNGLERRIPYRRVLKKAIRDVESSDAKGIRVQVSGRLSGADIARSEKLNWGKLPLHTLRADIDYAKGVAATIYGSIGVKVWIYKGDKFGIDGGEKKNENDTNENKNKSNKNSKENDKKKKSAKKKNKSNK